MFHGDRTAVTKHKVGDRVGVGCMVNSCGKCVNCRNGEEQYCLEGMVVTYDGIDRDGTVTQGGYSTHVVVVEDFVMGAEVTVLSRSLKKREDGLRLGADHFCAAHGLGSEVEIIAIDQVNEA